MLTKGILASGAVCFTLTALPGVYAASLTPVSDVTLKIDVGQKPVGHWSGGRLLLVESQSTFSPSILVIDRNGELESRNPFTIPGAEMVVVHGYARGDNETLVVSGEAFEAPRQAWRFLAIIAAGGGTTQVIRTEQYKAYKAAVAGDGSIWTSGTERLDRSPSSDWKAAWTPCLSAGVVRHFDSQGKQLASFVPQSTIHNLLALVDDSNSLVAAGGRVGWYCPKEQRYVEIAADGTVSDLQGIQTVGKARPDGFGLTNSGLAFLAARDDSGKNWIFQLDKNGKKWLPMRQETSFVELYGADGETLVTSAPSSTIHFLHVSQ